MLIMHILTQLYPYQNEWLIIIHINKESKLMVFRYLIFDYYYVLIIFRIDFTTTNSFNPEKKVNQQIEY